MPDRIRRMQRLTRRNFLAGATVARPLCSLAVVQRGPRPERLAS